MMFVEEVDIWENDQEKKNSPGAIKVCKELIAYFQKQILELVHCVWKIKMEGIQEDNKAEECSLQLTTAFKALQVYRVENFHKNN